MQVSLSHLRAEFTENGLYDGAFGGIAAFQGRSPLLHRRQQPFGFRSSPGFSMVLELNAPDRPVFQAKIHVEPAS